MSEESSASRSSRRNAQKPKQTITGFSKKMNIFAAGTLAVFLLASAGVGVAMRTERTVPLAKTPENATSKLYFQNSSMPEGWKANASAVLEGRGDLTAAQNPAQIFSPDGNCSYTRQVFHIPSYQNGRTDDYLTRQYLYEVAESNGASAQDSTILSLATDKGKLDFLSASYLVKGTSADKDKDTDAKNTVYRSNAVRAIDKVVQIEGVEETEGLFGSDASKGIPVFFLSYECKTRSDWNADTWKSLVESTKLSIYSEEVPGQVEPEPQQSENNVTDAPSTTPQPSEEPSKTTAPETEDSASPTDITSPGTAESTEETP